MSKQVKRSQNRASETHPGSIWGHLALVIVAFSMLAGIRMQYPELSHGDDHADASVLVAGQNFDRLGFMTLKFIHVWNPQATGLSDTYTHYPAGPEIANGVLRRVMKLGEVWQFRIVALGISLMGVIGFWFFLERVFGIPWLATVGVTLLICHPVFLSLFDSLHQTPYTEALRAWGLFGAIWLADCLRQPKKPWLAGATIWAILLASALFTYETLVFLWAFAVLSLLMLGKAPAHATLKWAVLLGTAPVAGVALRILNNAWYYGGLQEAAGKLAETAVLRSTASGDVAGASVSLQSWYDHVLAAFTYNVFSVGLPLLAGLVLALFAWSRSLKDEEGGRIALIVATLCGLSFSWYFLMPAHNLAHAGLTWPQRHLVLAAALLWTAYTRMLALGFGRLPLEPNWPRASGLLALVPVAFLALKGVLSSELPLSKERTVRQEAFLDLRKQLIDLGKSTPADTLIATNYFRHPFIAYYTDRRTLMIPQAAVLAENVPIPDVFLLVPFNTPETQELARRLEGLGFRAARELRNGYLPIIVFSRP